MRVANDRQTLDDFLSHLKFRNHRAGEFVKRHRGWNRSFSISECCAGCVLTLLTLIAKLAAKRLRLAKVNVDLFYAGQAHAPPYKRAFFAVHSLGSHECHFLATNSEKT